MTEQLTFLTDDENRTEKSKIVSGYRIYDAAQKRRTVRNDLPSLYPDFPEKRYDIIYADPPWDYGGKMQFDKSGKTDVNVNWENNIFISAALLIIAGMYFIIGAGICASLAR
jgi:16S rRNA G966 N2-methylase RsmD